MSTGRRNTPANRKKTKQSHNGMAVAIGIIFPLLVVGGTGWYVWGRSATHQESSPQVGSAPVDASTPHPQPVASPPAASANLDFGPAAPTGLVLSQAMIQDLLNLVLADAQAAGADISPEKLKEQAAEGFRSMRNTTPEFLCVPPADEQSLLSGSFPLETARKEFENAVLALDAANLEYPALVADLQDRIKKQQPISAAQFLAMAQLAQLKAKMQYTSNRP